MRSGFNTFAAKGQTVLEHNPYSGHVFVFGGKRGDLLKCLYFCDGGLCVLPKQSRPDALVLAESDCGSIDIDQHHRRPCSTDWPVLVTFTAYAVGIVDVLGLFMAGKRSLNVTIQLVRSHKRSDHDNC